MSGFNLIDMSQLPSPDVVEELDYETILAAMLKDLRSRDPAFTVIVESDPAYKILEVAAYREMLLRHRVNDATRAVMVAHAVGADLDNLAALVPLARRVVDPGDPDAIPPVPSTYESDAEFRRRVQLAPEGFSTAGPDGGYIFHALTVSGCRDAAVSSPAPGEVMVHVLGRDGDGTPNADTLSVVEVALNARNVRPLTDQVSVQAAGIVNYNVEATVHTLPGPAPEAVEAEALAAVQAYVAARHVLGVGTPVSGIYAALHVEGVAWVALTSPSADVTVAPHQAAYCTGITLVIQEAE